MKKYFYFFVLLGIIPQLSAETLVQIYPPSWLEVVSGKYALFNTFREGTLDTISKETFHSDESGYTMFNLPIEIRQTVVEFSAENSLLADGGLSFYFENGALSSINISAGLTFGYGYNRNNAIFFLRRFNVTIYPLYEFPLAIFWKTPKFPWKFALDIGWEFLQLGPVSISVYARAVCWLTSDAVSGFTFLPDFGLTVGWVF
ncbi:MAG: hypothetical protein LBI28_14910 [Treponema sp.]|jgi:hypothetical protein|nr:hypothetical protein [Treponema sp.]